MKKGTAWPPCPSSNQACGAKNVSPMLVRRMYKPSPAVPTSHAPSLSRWVLCMSREAYRGHPRYSSRRIFWGKALLTWSISCPKASCSLGTQPDRRLSMPTTTSHHCSASFRTRTGVPQKRVPGDGAPLSGQAWSVAEDARTTAQPSRWREACSASTLRGRPSTPFSSRLAPASVPTVRPIVLPSSRAREHQIPQKPFSKSKAGALKNCAQVKTQLPSADRR